MQILFIIAFISRFVSSSDKYKLTRYIEKYEIVDCYVYSPRIKRDFFMSNDKIKKSFDAEVRFKSYKTNFHLLLTEDIAFKELKVETFSYNNTIQPENVTIKMFEGVIKNTYLRSYAIGYLNDSTFTGSVNLNETLYFIEPAKRFFSNYSFTNKIVVYREEDIVFENLSDIRHFNEQIILYNYDNLLPKGINRTENGTEDYACMMEFVSDHTLHDYFDRDINEVTAYLYLHGKYADFIFRRADFDGDGKRDRIRIIIDKIFIYKSENDPDYPMVEASDMYVFLKKFSYRTQKHCLAVCMTAKIFTNTVIGAAFKASAEDSKPPGGICQKPIEPSYYNRETRSLNTLVLTIKNMKGNTLPLSATLLSLAHELGHSFGSDHDSLENLTCSPGSQKGFYLMHAMSQNNQKSLSSFFSPCSRKQIASVIAARGECLKPHPATCGNAIQEGSEECDCGKKAFCQHIDQCCAPSDAKPPEKGCTFSKAVNATCSPKEDKCCLENCMINVDKNALCHRDLSECKVSFCDGKSKDCPKPKEAPDKFPCRGTSKSCSGGVCNSSVCLDNGLSDCVCNDLRFECYICCKKGGKCIPASLLGFKAPDGQQYYALEGSVCNLKRYQCDGSGNCVDSRRRSIAKKRKLSVPLWIAFCGLILALLILGIVLMYFLKFYPIRN